MCLPIYKKSPNNEILEKKERSESDRRKGMWKEGRGNAAGRGYTEDTRRQKGIEEKRI